MTQRQIELQKLISMEQEKDKNRLMDLDQIFMMSQANNQIQNKTNPLSQTIASLEKELNQDIYLDDKDLKKKEKKEKKKYSSTKVKARNFLTNISYNGIKKNDYENPTFVIDIFAYLILYFNPFGISGKFETEVERSYINILWGQLLPQNFYTFVSKKDHLQILNKKNVKFRDAVEIVKLFIEVSDGNTTQKSQYELLKLFLKKNIRLYQYIFSNLFPRYYGKFNTRGVEISIEFNSLYANYLDDTNVLNWQKNQFLEENMPIVIKDEEVDSESESDVEIVNNLELKKEEKQKQKRIERKEKMRKQKKILEEKLKENTEKMNKIKKKVNI